MLTSFGDDEALFGAIMAGAAGYVLKQIRGTDLVGAVRTVASGQSMLDPRAASQLMARLRDQPARHDPLAGLSAQERRILELIGEGLTNRQIGERMANSGRQVRHVRRQVRRLVAGRHQPAAGLATRPGARPPHLARRRRGSAGSAGDRQNAGQTPTSRVLRRPPAPSRPGHRSRAPLCGTPAHRNLRAPAQSWT